MLSKMLVRVALALALSVGATHAASASVVDFNDHVFGSGSPDVDTNSAIHQGLSFGFGYGAYYDPTHMSDFPLDLTANGAVMGATVWDAQGMGLTIEANRVLNEPGSGPAFDVLDPAHQFSLRSLDLSTGADPDFNGIDHGFTTLTGYFADGGTDSRLLTVGLGFQTYNIDWTGLTNVVFRWTDVNGTLLVDDYDSNGDFVYAHPTYLAFDNINFSTGAIPEPATWAMLLLGFGGIGAAIRGARRRMRLAA